MAALGSTSSVVPNTSERDGFLCKPAMTVCSCPPRDGYLCPTLHERTPLLSICPIWASSQPTKHSAFWRAWALAHECMSRLSCALSGSELPINYLDWPTLQLFDQLFDQAVLHHWAEHYINSFTPLRSSCSRSFPAALSRGRAAAICVRRVPLLLPPPHLRRKRYAPASETRLRCSSAMPALPRPRPSARPGPSPSLGLF